MLLLFMKEMSFPAKRSMQNKLFQSNFDCLHIYIWLNLISFLRPNEHIMWMICNLIEFNTIFISKTALLKFQICKILAWVGLLSGAQVTQWLWQQTSELGNVDKGYHPSPSYPIETIGRSVESKCGLTCNQGLCLLIYYSNGLVNRGM